MTDYGYRIDHIPETDRCCESHNINCEPPGDLCCDECAEIRHYLDNHMNIYNPTGTTFAQQCVLARCDCSSEQAHLDTTQPGYAGDRIGMRQPLEVAW